MEKRIGLAIVVMVAVIVGGFAYANIPQSQQNAVPDAATSVAFQNNGNSWKHVVAAFDITNVDGSIKSIYADLWVKPQGTATVDLSSILGKVNQALPEGTKIQLKTYTDPNVPASEVPQGVKDSKVTTTTDSSQGGQFLSAITPSVSAADPIVSTPTQTVIANTFTAIFRNGQFVTGASAAVPVCANAGGVTAAVPITSSGGIGPVIAKTPRITIVLPL